MTSNENTPAGDASSNLIWIDLEMTGLNTITDQIIEIATVVTDLHLNEIAEGPVLAIHQPKEIMDGMDEWNTTQHGESGLTERVLDSKLSMQDAEKQTIDFLEEYVNAGASRCVATVFARIGDFSPGKCPYSRRFSLSEPRRQHTQDTCQ